MYFAPHKLILIVEDDADIGYLLVQIIHQQTSHRAIHHLNAGEAIKSINTLTPHLFILDYSLPDMTGLELHDWFRAIDRLKHIPAILLSARNPPVDEIQKRGILLMRKPFAVTKLLTHIENFLVDSRIND